MGIGGISIWQLVIVLVIVVMLFGTKRLRGLGGDLGGAIKGFKKAMGDESAKNLEDDSESSNNAESNITENKAAEKSEQTEQK